MDGEQQGIAVQVVTGGDETLGQDDSILIVEGEVSVALTVEVGDDVVGLACHLDDKGGVLHIDIDGSAGAKFVDEAYLELLRPDDAPFIGIALGDDDVAVLVGRMDGGHTFLLHPYLAELSDIGLGCRRVEGGDEIIPRGIVEQVVTKVFLQACLHLRGTHHLFEHPHHDGRFVVDNIVVEQAGVVQVIQFLGDGVGAVGTVDGDGTALVGLQEVQLVVDARERATGDLRRHEVGEHLLGPYILKPFE